MRQVINYLYLLFLRKNILIYFFKNLRLYVEVSKADVEVSKTDVEVSKPVVKFQNPTLKFSSRRKRRRDVAQTANHIYIN